MLNDMIVMCISELAWIVSVVIEKVSDTFNFRLATVPVREYRNHKKLGRNR
jgi:hypothetical protein